MMWPIHSYKPFDYEHIYLSVSIKRYINVYSLPHKMIPAFGLPTTDTCGKCPCSLLRCPSQHQAADTPGQAHLNLLEAVFFSIQVLVVFSKIELSPVLQKSTLSNITQLVSLLLLPGLCSKRMHTSHLLTTKCTHLMWLPGQSVRKTQVR